MGSSLDARVPCKLTATTAERPEEWLDSCDVSADVECWIDHADESTRRVVRIAGRLASAQVPDLLRVCASGERRELVLDLSDLLNADPVGLEALRRLQREGATFVKVSQYIRLKLDAAPR